MDHALHAHRTPRALVRSDDARFEPTPGGGGRTPGARHQTLFIVQAEPSTVPTGMSAKAHFQPFEDNYYFTRGKHTASWPARRCGRRRCVVAGVNTSLGFTKNGDRPMRWIEARAPMPRRCTEFCSSGTGRSNARSAIGVCSRRRTSGRTFGLSPRT
jgi:hypothetical protein